MRRLLSSVALTAATLSSSSAQVPDVPTPDPLGANFRHDSIGTSTPTDFDFLDGKWRADGSTDGGKTWMRDFWKIEANRAK